MSAEVERQLTSLVASNATTYAFREVGLSGTTVPIRVVVIQMTKAYAETKPLDELHGFGGPNSYPQRTVTSGIPTYLHSDATPNFLAWQQGTEMVTVYSADHAAMRKLAQLLIEANR